jgi:O-acetyl-ADP-ribose deacetylase (regulator of RNase III)
MLTIVTACLGNIVKQPDCDAIVNSANPSLRAGSGVCGAIHRAAGSELERSAMQYAPLSLTHAVATPGFNLPNRLVIHCRGPKYNFDPEPAASLARCLENILLLADSKDVARIAIPAISMGIYGYPPDEAAPILIGKVLEMATLLKHVEEIRFVLTSEKMLLLFIDSIGKQTASCGAD